MTVTADLLETMTAASRRAAELREAARPLDQLERSIVRPPRGAVFVSALQSSAAPRVIAECKRRSPSRGILRREYDPAAHARRYAAAGAAAVSVLTEPTFFDGALDHLSAVRAAVDLPLLRKDFVVSEYQLVEAAAYGADAALLIVGSLADAHLRRLVGRCEALGVAALVEVHDRTEAARAVDAGARVIGVNCRNLRTLAVDTRVHEEVVDVLPRTVVAVAESGLRSPKDLSRLSSMGYHAFLVGEQLIVRDDPGAALMELRAW
jgi:indole-3-glycerol phosphate synthase